ncbi:MAG: hypothetical protein H7293_07875 [Candidatus Saccharibacteria bacterium]|nr:hypothetical protein [Rhodoferax sp.]
MLSAIPPPLTRINSPAAEATRTESEPEKAAQGLKVVNAPIPELSGSKSSVEGGSVLPSGSAEPVSVNVDQMSIKAFAQFVFGSLLKKTVALDAKLAQRTDLITLRTDTPQTARQVAETAKLLLQGYGVSVTEFDSLVRVNPADSKGGDLPLLRRGRASADTPTALRPVFHLVELEATRSSEVLGWIKTMFGTKVDLQDVSGQNSILISGAPENVTAALDMVRALDAPRMRGRIAKRLSPAFVSATDLVSRLNELLTAQGYSVSSQVQSGGTSAIVLVPVASLNTVFVFAASQAVAEHVVKWAAELDQAPPKIGNAGFLSYPVMYSDAQSLAKTMSDLMSAGTAVPTVTTPSGSVSGARTGGRVVVNSATNSLIIQGGSADEQRQWRALLQELDRPVKSALIEVVVAELTLGAKEQLGVEWKMVDQVVNGGIISGGTLGGLGIGTGGLGLSFLNDAGQVRGLLNFLGSSSNSRILSSPKLMARNAETATIQVGQEVPIVTSQQTGTATSPANTTGGVLQTIQYRSTGVILKVKPIILAGGRLDLEVAQEVSSAAQTTTGVVTSPTISSRRVDTKLSLRDGGTVMLAGLISNDTSKGNSGVPVLKDLPGIGNLFKTQNESNNKTELVILITAHILNDDFESESITESFRQSLGPWLAAPDSIAQPKAGLGYPKQAADLKRPAAATAGTEMEAAGGKEILFIPKQQDPGVVEVPAQSKRNASNQVQSVVAPSAGTAAADGKNLLGSAASSSAPVPSRQSPGDEGPMGRLVTDPALIEELKRAAGR